VSGGKLAALAAGLAVGVLGMSPASGSTDSLGASAARCKSGSVDAVVAGKRVCLRRGQLCSKRQDRRYHRYGFHCHSGRLTGGPNPDPPSALPPAGRVIATVPAPSWGGIAVGGGAVWVSNTTRHTVTRVDPQTNAVAATIAIGDPSIDLLHGPTFLAFGHGTLWVLDGRFTCSCVHRVDPTTNRVVTTIPLGVPTQARLAPLGIAATADAVWVTNRWGSELAGDGSVIRIDPQTNEIVAIIGLGSSPETGGPTGIAAVSSAIWVGVPSTKSVVRIDPASNSVVATVSGFFCADGQLAADGSTVWVADCNTVRRIDTQSNAITKTIPIPGATGSGVRGISLELGSVWVQAGPLIRIDPSSGAVAGVLPLAPVYVWGEYSIASAFGSVWVRQTDKIVRIQP